jgi:SAM-dependent methyltransferase
MIEKHGPDFFDDHIVFEHYLSGRQDPTSANEILEKPVLMELIGSLQNTKILDLGCGDARFGREALEQGCDFYVGLEGSRNMVQLAKENLVGTNGIIHHANIEDWDFPEQHFDLVISRLAVHYLEDVSATFEKVNFTLLPGGRFIFSIEHPVITSSDRARSKGEQGQAWIVDDYFETGKRVTNWIGAKVIKYHRTIEDYFMGLREAGFSIDAVRESRPQAALFLDEATYLRRKRIPLMLFFSAHRS